MPSPTALLVIASVSLLAVPATRGAAQPAPEPPGRLVDVDGRTMHLHCAGSGAPTVVIDAGAGAWSLAWLHIQRRVSPLTRVCVYDRAGLGWSEAREEPRTSERAARELRALLGNAGEAPPFVLAGHSYGGYNVRVFADLFAEDVAGLALIESAHEDQWERLPPIVKRLLDASLEDVRARAEAAEDGRIDPDSVRSTSFFSRDPFLDAAYRAEQTDPDHHRTYLAEIEEMAAITDRVRATASLGRLPLAVLSSARGFDR